MVGSYTLTLHCQNCGDVHDYEIEKGIRVSSVDCDNCGVKSLNRTEHAVTKGIEERLKDEIAEEMGLDL